MTMSGGSSCDGGGGGGGGDGGDVHLPEGAWIEILVWLPVISLLRFKTVCNSWREIIETPDFIRRHATVEDKVETFILQGTITFGNLNYEPHFYLVSGEKFEVLENLPVPSRYRVTNAGHPVNMVGSCHGIVCLHDPKPRDIALWNPTIKQFRILPKSLVIDGVGQCVDDFVAFGFDVESRDYKVLQITSYSHRPGVQGRCRSSPLDCSRRIQVYNLSTDSWRFIDARDLPNNCSGANYDNNHGRYLNGKFISLRENWFENDVMYMGHTSRQLSIVNVILLFDFSKETFETIQIPDKHNTPVQLAFLGEKIVFIEDVTETKTFDRVFCVWALDENGAEKSSWSKLYNIGPLYECPITISRNGEFGFVSVRSVRQTNQKNVILQLCNLSTLEIKDYQAGEDAGVYRADVYKRSLLPVRSS